jgi:hypothetical protein
MHITSTVEVIAFSSDGAAALVARREDGPEGGGSLSFVLVGRGVSGTLTSTFSPGDGSTPETVSAAACRAVANALAAATADFVGVSVQPRACAQDRTTVVRAAPEARRAVAAARAGVSADRWKVTGDTATADGVALVLRPGETAEAWGTGPLLLVVVEGGMSSRLALAHDREGRDVPIP